LRFFANVVLVFSIVLSGCQSPETGTQSFTVSKGASVRQIANALQRDGFLQSPALFIFWAKVKAGSPKPGIYELSRGRSASFIWDQIRKGPRPLRLTFPEGWTSWQMAQYLEEKGITSAKDFLAIVQREKLEGRLFPDTYLFDVELPASKVLEKMRARFEQQKPIDWDSQARVLGLKEEQLLVLASLVEREARVERELPLVAGVFLNRFKKGWLLESCATVQYAIGLSKGTPGLWKPRLLYKDLAIASPFNTYKQRGFPPGPIGNPGRAAMNAAAHPAETDAMFFVADGEGTHRFSRYYREHLKAKEKRR